MHRETVGCNPRTHRVDALDACTVETLRQASGSGSHSPAGSKLESDEITFNRVEADTASQTYSRQICRGAGSAPNLYCADGKNCRPNVLLEPRHLPIWSEPWTTLPLRGKHRGLGLCRRRQRGRWLAVPRPAMLLPGHGPVHALGRTDQPARHQVRATGDAQHCARKPCNRS